LGLDVTSRALFYRVLLSDLAEHPRTVLLSTHLIEESESLFDRVVILDRGRVVVDADRDDARDLAATVSGIDDAVDLVIGGRHVFQTHTIGGLKSVTIAGSLDAELLERADNAGVKVAPASLQDLVAAYGAGDPTIAADQVGAWA